VKWQNRINNAYDFWKEYLHILPVNYGRQIHHIWGRVGILKCCPALFAMLTPAEHENSDIKKELRERTMELKRQVEENYERRGDCKAILLPELCGKCPMRREI